MNYLLVMVQTPSQSVLDPKQEKTQKIPAVSGQQHAQFPALPYTVRKNLNPW